VEIRKLVNLRETMMLYVTSLPLKSIDNNKGFSININFGNAYLGDCEVHIQPINKIGAVIN